MNLDMIQSRLQDIKQMREVSDSNHAALINLQEWKGRNGTDCDEGSVSSLSFRFLLVLGIFAFLVLADIKKLPGAENLLREAEKGISYNIKTEDVVNLREVWYNKIVR